MIDFDFRPEGLEVLVGAEAALDASDWDSGLTDWPL